MKNNKNWSLRTWAIIYSIAFVIIFSMGAYARPGIDTVAEITSALFTTKQVYAAPISEYETKVNELWKSDKHQSVCRSNAAAVVAMNLARRYVDEAEKQAALSNYDLPATEAITKTAEYGKR